MVVHAVNFENGETYKCIQFYDGMWKKKVEFWLNGECVLVQYLSCTGTGWKVIE
jgi:hypothetical protein